jgi:6-phosphogluconolactonase (cycloisomerase 2 family)
MKTKALILFLLLVMAAAAVMVGCGGSSAPPQIGLLYLVGQGSNNIIGLKLLGDGELSALPLSNFATNPRPVAMVLHPTKDFIYVANLTSNTVSGFNLDRTTGVLTPVGTAVAPSLVGTAPIGVGINSTGQFLFVLNQGSATVTASISVFSIDPARGLLTEIAGSPFPTLANPQFLVVSPTSPALYVANGTLSTISGFVIGAGGGLTSVGAPFSVGAGANVMGVAMDPKGQFLFAADSVNNKVVGFSVASGTGVLSPVGSPVAAGTASVAVTVDNSGQFLYASNRDSDNVSAYTIKAGVLTEVAGSPFSTKASGITTSAQPGFLTVDFTNSFLFVSNVNARSVAVFGINTDGTLSAVTNSPFNEVVSASWILTTK